MAVNLGVQHISLYGLKIEEGCYFYENMPTNLPDDDEQADMYLEAIQTLKDLRFEHYEVSNFALPGRRSKHNSSYWNDTPYIGLGAGAHSYDGQVRSWNISDLDQYIAQALAHDLQPEKEVLSEEDRKTERVMLGLRTNQGIANDEIDRSKVQPYIHKGLLEEKDNRIVATTKGYHILNRIIEDLI